MEIKDKILVQINGDYNFNETTPEVVNRRITHWGIHDKVGYECNAKSVQLMRLFALTITRQLFMGETYVNEMKSTISSEFSEEDLEKFEEMFLVMENKVLKEYLELDKNGLKPRGNPLTRVRV